VADFRIATVEAQVDGADEWIPVPLSFFGANAYSVSHGWLDPWQGVGHYPERVPGITYASSRRAADGRCATPEPPTHQETANQKEQERALFEVFIRARHKAALADPLGQHSFYFRLHHHPSIPAYYRYFNALDLRDIRRYRLVTRSVCLSMSSGQIIRRVLLEDAYIAEIR
jgi:hypothetical protein